MTLMFKHKMQHSLKKPANIKCSVLSVNAWIQPVVKLMDPGFETKKMN